MLPKHKIFNIKGKIVLIKAKNKFKKRTLY